MAIVAVAKGDLRRYRTDRHQLLASFEVVSEEAAVAVLVWISQRNLELS